MFYDAMICRLPLTGLFTGGLQPQYAFRRLAVHQQLLFISELPACATIFARMDAERNLISGS